MPDARLQVSKLPVGFRAHPSDQKPVSAEAVPLLDESVGAGLEEPGHLAPIAAPSGEAGIRQNDKFTMEKDFFKDILTNEFGLEVIIPNPEDSSLVHQVIYEELVRGQLLPASNAAYQSIIAKAASNGAEGVILGCTEIPLLIKAPDVEIPIFDTTLIHAEAAVQFALETAHKKQEPTA